MLEKIKTLCVKILFLIISFSLTISLLSYDIHDASWNTTSNANTNNWLGTIGSHSSDICLQIFGKTSFLIAIGMCFWSILTLLNHPFGKLRKWISFVGIFLFSWLIYPTHQTPQNVLDGGLIGFYLHKILPSFSLYISILLWGIFTLLCIFFFKIPVSKISPKLYKLFLKIINGIAMKFTNFKTNPPVIKNKKEKQSPSSVPVKKNLEKIKKVPALLQTNTNFKLPPSDILSLPSSKGQSTISPENIKKISSALEEVLKQFSINGQIVNANPGPVVTLYEFEPASGIKTSRVISLADDIAREMRVVSVRIAVVPGSNVIGIEIPNPKRDIVLIRSLIEEDKFIHSSDKLPLILGKDIGGTSIYADLAKMPHLLIAGTTGSGKSVSINTMILSILYRWTPEECRLIMIDPKMLELSIYNDIPHLLTPVVTDPSKAVVALKWAVKEMEDRYRAMSHLNVRNIDGYNQKLISAKASGQKLTRNIQSFDTEGNPIIEEKEIDLTPIPYIVIIVDEMADLMLVAGKEVEAAIQRLAQMARAAGIHLIMATQRPSVDVITGTIKANFPTRISFQVTSKIDSRTILGEQGAEQLLGRGDMLYMAAGQRPKRVHAPFVSDEEIEQVVSYLLKQGKADYLETVLSEQENNTSSITQGNSDKSDSLYDQAVAIILRDKKVSISYIQRQLRIGYNRAADIIDKMEAEGVISKQNIAGKREILIGE